MYSTTKPRKGVARIGVDVAYWIRRGEYYIGINEFGREVALIKAFPAAKGGQWGRKEFDGHGRPVYYDRNGRVIA